MYGQIVPGFLNTGVFKWNKLASSQSNRATTSNAKLTRKPYTSRAHTTGRLSRSNAPTPTISTVKFTSRPTNPFLLASLTNQGAIMLNKILLGLVCASMLVLLAVGGLGLALGIGPVFMSLAYTVIGGAGLVVFSGLLGE